MTDEEMKKSIKRDSDTFSVRLLQFGPSLLKMLGEVLGGDDCGKLYGVKFKIKTLMDIIEGEE